MHASRINGYWDVFKYVISVSRYSLRLRDERTSMAPNMPKIESSQNATLEQEEDSFEGSDVGSDVGSEVGSELGCETSLCS